MVAAAGLSLLTGCSSSDHMTDTHCIIINHGSGVQESNCTSNQHNSVQGF